MRDNYILENLRVPHMIISSQLKHKVDKYVRHVNITNVVNFEYLDYILFSYSVCQFVKMDNWPEHWVIGKDNESVDTRG